MHQRTKIGPFPCQRIRMRYYATMQNNFSPASSLLESVCNMNFPNLKLELEL